MEQVSEYPPANVRFAVSQWKILLKSNILLQVLAQGITVWSVIILLSIYPYRIVRLVQIPEKIPYFQVTQDLQVIRKYPVGSPADKTCVDRMRNFFCEAKNRCHALDSGWIRSFNLQKQNRE